MSKETISNSGLFEAELFISSSLRFGVYSSAAVITFGLALYFIVGRSGYPTNNFPTSLAAIILGIFQLKSVAVISFGLILLIATPVFRVAASVLLFILEKDHVYTVITLFVLVVLLVSFWFGKTI